MVLSGQPRRAARFGVFEVDFAAGELRKSGIRITLHGQQPFLVLSVLLERAGQVVTREELSQKLWPGDTFVDFEHGLATAISKIRDALGDSAENPRYIETLPRRGYRFIAEVTFMDGPVPGGGQPPPGELVPQDHAQVDVAARATSRPRLIQFAWKIAGVIVIVGVAGLVLWRFPSGSHPAIGIASANSIRSIAVLPLESLSGDASQDYFADGMTDELITDLGKISALRVISRTSVMPYKRVRKPLPEIARELNVDAVVEGTVLRSGNEVRITAQLIDASADKHLWANSYRGDLHDALALQNTVAREIAEQIRITLTPQEQAILKQARVVDPEAYEDYLKGRYFWNKRTVDGLRKATDYFGRAVKKDPSYAQAYAGLADSYALSGDWEYGILSPKEAFPKAKAAAARALELDSSLGEAHTSLAFVFDLFDWDWVSAEREFRQAIALNPGYATAHQWYGWHLSEMGSNREALTEMKKAESLDPLSLIISADVAEELLVTHSFDESIRQSRKTVEMDPNFALAHYELGQAYVQKHMYKEAIAELQEAVTLSGGSTACTSNLAYAYAASGRRSEALKILAEMKRRSNPGYSDAPEIALIYVGLGDKDQAMTWLEKAYAERFNPSVLLRPAFDPLRLDARFQNLMHRIGLPVQK
jgi:TolB-like protein/DNA-binding winged helix-turn-helix (wHTH) protein/Tfp pilus assembly protein PilF